MKTANIMKVICVAGLTAACTWGLAGCGSGNTSAGTGTGGVAATVNGTEVAEDKITAMIESIRVQSAIETEEAWGTWLAQNSMTPESVRDEMINSFTQEELMKMGAKEKNITVEGSEVDAIVSQMKSNFETDETWQQALSQAGFTEAEYRERIESQILQNKLSESFVVAEEPTQEDLVQYAGMYSSAYTGAKRASHVLFDAADEATAQSVLEQINNGTLAFADAATQHSKDTASAANGGDVGWDKLNTFVTEFSTALSALEKDQVSGLVKTEFGFHIIKCTDVFTAPESITSTDQIPAEFLTSIKTSLAQQKKNEAFQAWFTEFQEKADIKINPMPQGLPYAVDMSKYPAPASSDAGTDASAGTDPSASGTETGTGAEGSQDTATSDSTAENAGEQKDPTAEAAPAAQ